MRSMILNSYRRNLRSYTFFIIALALAFTVCSLGLSGTRMMASLWRYPYLQEFGGHIVIRNQTKGWRDTEYVTTLLSRVKVEEMAASIFPEAELTATAEVPARIWLPTDRKFSNQDNLVGRSGGLDTWYLLPPPRTGVTLSRENLNQQVFVLRGPHLEDSLGSVEIPVHIAAYTKQGDQETWQLIGAPKQQLPLTGTTNYPSYPGLWGHLSVVQQLSGLPTDRVNRIGIALPGLDAQLDDRVEQLRERVAREMPELEVVTIDDYALLIQPSLLGLHRAAARYTPVLIGLSLILVAATALALVQSRCRELALLRIIGMSQRQVWLLFAAECVFSALLALCFALFLLTMGVRVLLQSGALPLLPFIISAAAAVGAATLIARFAVTQSIPSTLRNA